MSVLIFIAFMGGALFGLTIYALVEHLIKRRDEHTDALMRRGMRALSNAEVDELFSPRYAPISPRDFQVVERGHALRFERPDPEIVT